MPGVDLALSPTIVCRVQIGADGRVENARVYQSRPELAAFEKAALDALREYQFEPARKTGVAVSAWINFPVAFEQQPQAPTNAIQIKGSDTIGGALGPAFGELYQRQYGAAVDVEALGSSTAFVGLFDGTADIGASSRSVRDRELKRAAELGIELREYAIGYDGIAIIVHPSNKLEQITVDQASKVFTGRLNTWSDLGGERTPIRVISRPSYSGTHGFFRSKVVRKGNKKSPEKLSPTAIVIEKTEEIVKQVATDPDAIAYVGLGWLSGEVRALAVAPGADREPIAPAASTVRDGSYPIHRPLLMYTRGNPRRHVANFLRVVFSPQGQRLVEHFGFVSGDVTIEISEGSDRQRASSDVHRIYFATASAALDGVDRQTLDEIVVTLRDGKHRAIIIGNADAMGSKDRNEWLSQRRARRVALYLKTVGLAADLYRIGSASEAVPIASNNSRTGRRANRRVDVYLVPIGRSDQSAQKSSRIPSPM